MKELIEYIAKSLASNPDEVRVTENPMMTARSSLSCWLPMRTRAR